MLEKELNQWMLKMYNLNIKFLILKMENKIINNELHPCQYCGKTCKGKQCKDCHLKMVEKKQGQCINCKNIFYALRLDGTKRLRCFDCQSIYNSKYISKCPICKIDYHAFLEDGRVFNKCYNCYKNTLIDCKKCSNKIPNNQQFCKNCYKQEKLNTNNHTILSIEDEFPEIENSINNELDYNINNENIIIDNEYEKTFKNLERFCRNKNCLKITQYTYCKDCYIKNKKNIFTCEKCNCQSKNSFKICDKCKKI